jgi:predicted metal-dependent hydrolase
VRSRTARRLTLRVGPAGVDVIQPARRRHVDVIPLFVEHAAWVIRQLDRIARLHALHPPVVRAPDQILFGGIPRRIALDPTQPPADATRSLETWLKRCAREEIDRELREVSAALGVTPRRIFLRNQRTMWGSCSSRGNISFNWRCVMAPPHVLRYLVVHEAAHLLIPNHSRRYWQTVRAHHPDLENAKQWLASNGHHLMLDLSTVIAAARPEPHPLQPDPSPLPVATPPTRAIMRA